MFERIIQKHESKIGAVGNVLEWYSFGLFMPFLPLLSEKFFPSENVMLKEMLSFLALAAGMFMRPFGAAIFGPIGDKFGRQKAISVSVILMVIPTFLIGCLPDYGQIGIWAPILLVFLRALQGISLGGEYTAAMVHLVEKAPKNRRGFYGCFSDAGSQAGVLLGGQSVVWVSRLFLPDEVMSFAWRIPFLLSVVLLPFAFLTPPKPDSAKPTQPREPIWKTLGLYKKEVGCTVAITAFSAVAFYTLLTFLPACLVWNKVLRLEEAAACSVYANLVMIVSIIGGGYLTDFYGRKPFMISGIIGVAAVACFMFSADVKSFEMWVLLQSLYGFFIGIYYSGRAAFFSESFPAKVRCTAVSLSLSVGQAVFGGLTPTVMNCLIKIAAFLPAAPLICVSLCAIYALKAMGKNEMSED
ncbi:MAG: MFS transporter [Holosporaceae bacterium]|jgi:MHS family proline/betaine transporter-like MFS transporter|nr:MFS transporter [Holosporaceae bacterium]